jgi:deoxyribodipyrimidine photo-lyase
MQVSSTRYQFPRSYNLIIEKLEDFNPAQYARSRNFEDGKVSFLSPYISRGVISTRFVYEMLLKRGFKLYQIEKFVQELAWRDYWQLQWLQHGKKINRDLKHPQSSVQSHHLPAAIYEAKTGIEAVDRCILEIMESGYMHNHMRMYVASIVCNIAERAWLQPAKWMYYYLLDADWASNALSWQWVAGTNSSKLYFANQQNINKYFNSQQSNTFLDYSYEELPQRKIPEQLEDDVNLKLQSDLPETPIPQLEANRSALLYTFYNLSPSWRAEEDHQRILILEPSHFQEHPISQKTLDFILDLAKNIPDIQIYSGEFTELKATNPGTNFIYKEHPFNTHFEGTEDPRDWLSPVKGDFRSFFAFWKQCKKHL